MTEYLLWAILISVLCGPALIIWMINKQAGEREIINRFLQRNFEALEITADYHHREIFNALSVQARGDST